MNTITTKIPFCGFNESEASDEIDTILEGDFDLTDIEYNSINDTFLLVPFAELYVGLFNDYFQKHTGITLSLTFEELDSPEFYDEDTDKIYCKVSLDILEDLLSSVDKTVLKSTIDDYEQPIDGCWSAGLPDWTLEQTEILLYAVLRQHGVYEIDYNEIIDAGDFKSIVRDHVETRVKA